LLACTQAIIVEKVMDVGIQGDTKFARTRKYALEYNLSLSHSQGIEADLASKLAG